jgi:protein transport protein SEC20
MAAAQLDAQLDSQLVALVDCEQRVLRELLRLSTLNTSHELAPAAWQSASGEIRSLLRAHAEMVELLEMLAVEQVRPAEEAEVLRHARRHRAEGESLAASLRDLATEVRANRARLEEEERKALFATGYEDGSGAAARHAPDARASAQSARNVTDSLRRTRQLMASELTRTEATLRSLDDQGKSLKGTLKEHRGITGTLDTGRRSLTRLQRRDLTDKFLMLLGFVFFLLVRRRGSHSISARLTHSARWSAFG